MKIEVRRIARKASYTIGRMFIDDKYFCDTLEDVDRGLTSLMPTEEVAKVKKNGATAIPTGAYSVAYTYSPKFKRQMPLLLGVKGFEAIRIHSGNSDKDTEGCILVGRNTQVGRLTESKFTFEKLNAMLQTEIAKGRSVVVEVM
ncbi:MAG: DUF5675 family protein [Prevotella sp.]|nr:DUF5675 family protein [Prevotella sp.]